MSFKKHLTRQADHITCSLDTPITFIGGGAIGSFAALQAAKMGCTNITVWDDDEVSVENMNCQFFPFRSIGRRKVDALAELIHDFTQVEIQTRPRRYTGSVKLDGIVITSVDSMAARKAIWDANKDHARCNIIIDPRMSIEDALMYVMNPNCKKDQAEYEATLYTDDEAASERCTAKATIYTANLLSGLVVKALKNHLMNESYPRITMWSIRHNDFISWDNRGEDDERNTNRYVEADARVLPGHPAGRVGTSVGQTTIQ